MPELTWRRPTGVCSRPFEDRGRAMTEPMDFLRLRLLVGPSTPELHGLRWELLCDPSEVPLVVLQESCCHAGSWRESAPLLQMTLDRITSLDVSYSRAAMSADMRSSA